MKNLVTKIALPGAILAFAMVLFGGTAYAYENFKLWQNSTGKQHRSEIQNSIDELARRIKVLKEQRASLENVLQEKLQTSDVVQVKQKIEAKDSEIQRLNDELKSKGKMIDISTAENDHNAEINAAETALILKKWTIFIQSVK
ncbi:hypothetical protein A9176_02805 [Leuconostoc garlicum]|uniref:Uncharacterized protein n=1 Tax=Leuconostoc garlicum TaxID=255248 RepID=A0ABN4WR06_9LACO|nr:hypothetical protein [Leuconostoc garlicum]AQN79369.1 hypothetical protein A9176_02805 [Leuconostoc garlicum]